jgi:ATP-dependent Clp protease protease subunit
MKDNEDIFMSEEIKSVMNYELQDQFTLNDYKNRKLYINDDIDNFINDQITYHILRYNSEDKGLPVEKRKPILLYVTSNGGSVTDGFSLIDVILQSKTPVYTINLGYQYSMGFLIGLAGHKRYSSKNATFLMHDGSNFIYNSTSKAKDQMKFQEDMEDHIKKYILSRSKLTEQEYDEKLRIEWYLYPEEAKANGFTDFIIGEDCELDEVI